MCNLGDPHIVTIFTSNFNFKEINVYCIFERERERERESAHEWGKGRKREIQNGKQAPGSVLALELTNCETMT